MTTILLIEDDPSIAQTLRASLSNLGYVVECVTTGAEARESVARCDPDLIILDLVLPDADGLLLTSTLTTATAAPILICSARTRQVDKVIGLKMGASDFIAKPFDLEELETRVEALLRRCTRVPRGGASTNAELRVGDLVITPASATVMLTDRHLHLTPTEYRLLTLLASEPAAVFDRQRLALNVWGYSDAGCDHVVDVHIGRLRSKLRSVPTSTRYLVTVRGRGFRLMEEQASSSILKSD